MKYEDIKTPEELFIFMKDHIRYGFVSNQDGNIYTRLGVRDDSLYERMLFESYFLQTPEELLISQHGICYDQVEFAKKWLVDHGYSVFTYFSDYHNHTILIYTTGKSYYLFERTFPKHNAIYKRDSFEEILEVYKMMQFEDAKEEIESINLYQYSGVEFGIGFWGFINHCKRSDKVITLVK